MDLGGRQFWLGGGQEFQVLKLSTVTVKKKSAIRKKKNKRKCNFLVARMEQGGGDFARGVRISNFETYHHVNKK